MSFKYMYNRYVDRGYVYIGYVDVVVVNMFFCLSIQYKLMIFKNNNYI